MQKDAGVEQASVTATRAGSVGTAEGTLWPGDRGWCSAALRCTEACCGAERLTCKIKCKAGGMGRALLGQGYRPRL